MPLDRPPSALDLSMLSRADVVSLRHRHTYPGTAGIRARLAERRAAIDRRGAGRTIHRGVKDGAIAALRR